MFKTHECLLLSFFTQVFIIPTDGQSYAHIWLQKIINKVKEVKSKTCNPEH